MTARHAMAILIDRFFFLQLIIGSCLTPALAQVTTTITPDTSLGTRVEQNGSIHTIDGGTIRGPNQFHSFGRFDVGTGDTAHFTGPSTLENILSRVTGGQQSFINGTLKSDMPGANLYLLNSAGVMFGPSARLDVNGSFHVSTADMLQLGEDGMFHVSLAEQSALSVSAPSAFGFLHGDPSGIRIEGSRLAVLTGQTMSVIGGDLDIVGDRGDDDPATLAAPSGQLHLVGVASPGEVVSLPSAAEPGVTVESFARLGSIRITEHALVDASGDGGGAVRIRGAQLDVDDAWIRADTEGDMSGGLIDVQVEVLMISSGGKLSVNTHNGSTSPGDEGVVSIVATDRVTLSGSDSRIETLTTGSGNAGQIVLRTGQLRLSGDSKIRSEARNNSSGNAGQITIWADRIKMSGEDTRIRNATRSSGDAGAVHIETKHLLITNGSRIQGSAFTGSTGNAGDVVIVADTLIVEKGGRIISSLVSPGEGGSVDLTVHDLTVRSGGRVTSNVDSGDFDIGFASGDAGRVVIRASGRVLVSGKDSIISSFTKGSGNAGQVTIEANQISITDHGQVNTETSTSGNGGNITIEANEITLADHRGVISTSSTSRSDDAGAGGNITVMAQSMVRMQNTEITTSVEGGEKRGGNIDMRANVAVLERSNIRADAFGGPGGNISIRTQGLIRDNTSEVTASSTLDVDGRVAVEGIIDVSGALKPISQRFAQAEALLQDRCGKRSRQQQLSRFLVRGRDRVPIAPNGLLPSPLVKTTGDSVAQPQWRRTDRLSKTLSHPAPALNAWQKDCVH